VYKLNAAGFAYLKVGFFELLVCMNGAVALRRDLQLKGSSQHGHFHKISVYCYIYSISALQVFADTVYLLTIY
jgi:hypothetical protein